MKNSTKTKRNINKRTVVARIILGIVIITSVLGAALPAFAKEPGKTSLENKIDPGFCIEYEAPRTKTNDYKNGIIKPERIGDAYRNGIIRADDIIRMIRLSNPERMVQV